MTAMAIDPSGRFATSTTDNALVNLDGARSRPAGGERRQPELEDEAWTAEPRDDSWD